MRRRIDKVNDRREEKQSLSKCLSARIASSGRVQFAFNPLMIACCLVRGEIA